VVKRARRGLLPTKARQAFIWLRARLGHDLVPLAMLFLAAAALLAFGKLANPKCMWPFFSLSVSRRPRPSHH